MNFLMRMLNHVVGIINQLPQNKKVAQSPKYRSSPPRKRNKKLETKVKPIKRQGLRHSEESFYNHPRR